MAEPFEIPFRALDELNGATLAGRFRLDRMVGRGGFGAVFVGEQISVGRKCAVKVLVPDVLEQPANVRRFEREARATSRLAHPNTIVIYDFGLDEERRLLYIAMEFIDGESLRDRIRRQRRLDLETAIWIAHQAAGSLHDAHVQGLVHRDVKPHNIMLTKRGGDSDFVKVIDFGIAKFLDEASILQTFHRVTQTGTIIGTPAYMSPEQVRSQKLDGRSDQYSLAAVLYQMLTGRTLFVGESPVDVAAKQLTHRPTPASELNSAVSVAVDAVLMRALEKESAKRFETITEFTLALADAAGVKLGTTDSAERRRELGEAKAAEAQAPTGPLAGATVPATTTAPMLDVPALPPVEVHDPPTVSLGASAVIPVPGAEPTHEVSETTRWPASIAVGIALVVVAVGVIVLMSRPPDSPPGAAALAAIEAPRDLLPIAEPDATAMIAADAGTPRDASPGLPDLPVIVIKPPVNIDVPRPRPAPRGEPAPEVRPIEVGQVTVTVVPWGTVVIDGKPRGEALRQTHELPAGDHLVELHQGGQSVARKTVDVQPGKNTMVKLFAAP